MNKHLFFKNYYLDDGARELAHLVKNKNKEATIKMASEMISITPKNAILIPVPSSTGEATDTLIIANEIAKQRPDVIVLNIVKGKNRKSLYHLKKNNTNIPDDFFGFYLIEPLKIGNIVILDTVYDTGKTLKSLSEIIPEAMFLTHSKS